MAANETVVAHRCDHRGLHAAHVSHQAGRGGGQRLGHCLGDPTDRRGHEGDLGLGIPPGNVDGPHLNSPVQAALVGVDPVDVPSAGP